MQLKRRLWRVTVYDRDNTIREVQDRLVYRKPTRYAKRLAGTHRYAITPLS